MHGRAILAWVCALASLTHGAEVLWQIGTVDHDYGEFAIAGNYSGYSGTFPNDVDYTIGTDEAGTGWPYIQPGTVDIWAGSRAHPFTVRFDYAPAESYEVCQLEIHLVASHHGTPPVITVELGGQQWEYKTTVGPGDAVLTDPSLGNFQTYVTLIDPALLEPTGNVLTITTSGSWMLYDAVVLKGQESIPPLTDFAVGVRPFWFHSPEGVSRNFRLDFLDSVLTGPATVEIVTPQGTYTREVNAAGDFISYVEVLAPMPYSTDPNDVTFTIDVDGRQITRTVSVPPERQWEVYLVHQTHLDIGYTHTQPEVMDRQVNHLYNALDYIDQTAGYSDQERFKWHPEGMWAVEEFLKRASDVDRARFVAATQDGLVHTDSLYAQAMTGIYSEEELFELMGAAKRYEQEHGLDITSAMQTDVPGYSWGLAPALAHWGVKYITLGPNGGHRVGHTYEWGDRPFYWVSPSGQERVLFWMAGTGYGFFHGRQPGHLIMDDEARIMSYLESLEAKGYPYDMVNLRYCIGGDNGPPNPALAEGVRQWNEKYAYPKLIAARNSEMMAEFERRYGDQIPTRQKDFTPYWEDGAASTAADTAMNRRACEEIVQAQTLWSMLDAGAFPHEEFDLAWQRMIMYDEHTWGAWNSISDPDSAFAVQQAEYEQQFAVDAANRTETLLRQALSGIRQEGTNAVEVLNTLNWARTELVLISAEDSTAGDEVHDASGAVAPSQRLSTGELAFIAQDIPALGARRYTVHAGSGTATGTAVVGGNFIRNGLISAQWDARSGAIISLTRSGIAGNLVDTSIGDGLNDYLYILGRDVTLNNQRVDGPVHVTVVDSGPLVATARIRTDAPGCSTLERELRVVDGIDQLFIANTVDKLKVRDPESVSFGFPFNVPEGLMKIDLQWGVMQPEVDQIEGANRNFFCTRRWVDVSNEGYGVSWSSLDAPMVQFHPMRFVAYGGDNGQFRTYLDPGQAFHSWVMNNHWETNYKADQEGVVRFRYALQPHVGGYDGVAAEHFGRGLHQPLVVAPVDPAHPVTTPMLEVQGEGVVVSTIEPSRDGTAIMARLQNRDQDNAVEVAVNWPAGGDGASIWLSSPFEERKSEIAGAFTMAPFEIVTLRLQKHITDPQVSVAEELDFGQVESQSDTFGEIKITNLGQSEELTTSAAIVSGDTDRFSVAAQAGPIAPGTAGRVYVRFFPGDTVGSAEAVAEITSNDPDEPVKAVTLRAEAAASSVYVQLDPPVAAEVSSAYAGYPAAQAIDCTPLEWASDGDGAGSFVTFDFGSLQTMSAVVFQDRAAVDRTEAFSLTFSEDSVFGNGGDVQLHFANEAGATPGRYEFAPQTARGVRWQAEAVSGGSNQGIAEIAFYAKRPVAPATVAGSKITATASSVYSAMQDAAKAVNGSGLTGDLHDNDPSSTTMWHGIVGPPFGGESNVHAGTEAGAEWIKFEFDRTYRLNEMIVWNHNQVAYGLPDLTDRGMRDVFVEYSADGLTYVNLAGAGQTLPMRRAPGMNGVWPTNVIDFGEAEARYVVITATAENPNFGGQVVGLSEVQFTTRNTAPKFVQNPVVKADAVELGPYSGALAAEASDPDADTLTFRKLEGASWLEVGLDGTLGGTPSPADTGPNLFAVQVSDGARVDLANLEIMVWALLDGKEGLADFAGFASQWLQTGCGVCMGADLNGDHSVGVPDLGVMQDHWLGN
ncbi:MAG: hypothetical protein JXB13_19105 [Phycisphaerae bacterium]|nr:hypothetical protein [Phycisphaerae bacterium]